MSKYNKPFRVGKKQKRAVLDANGLEVVIFPKGNEFYAEYFCECLNDAEFITISGVDCKKYLNAIQPLDKREIL